MTEPTAPAPDDFDEKPRAHEAEWGPIIAQADANAAVVRAQTGATPMALDPKTQALVEKADAKLQVLKRVDPEFAGTIESIFGDIRAVRDFQLPPLLDLGRPEDPNDVTPARRTWVQ